jgi:hypothetical protein
MMGAVRGFFLDYRNTAGFYPLRILDRGYKRPKTMGQSSVQWFAT